MDRRSTLLRLKRFEAAGKARRVALLETMIHDFADLAVDLARQIAAEEQRTRIKDAADVAYSTFAKATALRRRNLLISVADLQPRLDAAKRELYQVTAQLGDLELAQCHFASPAPTARSRSTKPRPASANLPTAEAARAKSDEGHAVRPAQSIHQKQACETNRKSRNQ